MVFKTTDHPVLITCDACSNDFLLEELSQMGAVLLPGEWLDTGDAVQGCILRVNSGSHFEKFSEDLSRFGSIFARHIAPVDYEVDLQGLESDIDTICQLLPEIQSRINSEKSFSVQTRILGEGKLPFRKVVLNETLSDALVNLTGAPMDCRQPEQVVSILCTPAKAYVGFSLTEQNRSAWPGGKHRFKREDDQISRAEFKLLEAMSVFDFELPDHGLALDIGASPGGWSRVLADRGLEVDAVDPADLDPRLLKNRHVRHFRRRIQEYPVGTKTFAVIVNDMKMDARPSIEIILKFAPRLSPEGMAVMTLKMPKELGHDAPRITLEMLRDDLERLAHGYQVIGARQLYHNRSEVTVVMKPLV